MRKIKNVMLILTFLSLIMCALIPLKVDAETTYNDVEIERDNHEAYYLWLFISKGNTVTVDVTCNDDTLIDVYIMRDSEYDKYDGNYSNSFTTMVAYEKIKAKNFEWKVPDDDTYWIVIDNVDNSRTTDAVPRMNVTIDIEYDTDFGKELEEAVETICYIIIAIIVIIVVVIIVVIVVMKKKKKQPPIQPQQPFQPQQPYPQYPPPQQQQFQQPQQYPPPQQQQFQQPQQYPPPQQQFQPPVQQAHTCQTCGGALRFVQDYNAWYCDKCQKYGN